ncbi:MAG: glucose-6-phosphate dehydrogenase [Chromatocurvus sp.]
MKTDMLVVGGEGDLALRKLYPALYALRCAQWIDADMRIVAVARKPLEQAAFTDLVSSWYSDQGGDVASPEWRAFTGQLVYAPLDATGADAMAELRSRHLSDTGRDLVVYLATPPQIFAPVCHAMQAAGLVRANMRIVVEKPLGDDLESFRSINADLTAIFSEDQVFRIDHYLGKETVQNLMATRFANAFLEPLWNNRYVDNVQITVAESIGAGGRWDFYDRAGAMRDMVQNHLLQILCIVAMEPPAHLAPDDVRNEKRKVLSCLRPMDDHHVRENTVVGQYTAGAIGGNPVPGYLEEEGASAQSDTETFVAIKAEIDNWRWAGVPFYLRTGKRLQRRMAEIVVEFKDVPHSIFGTQMSPGCANRLVIRLQPDEIIRLEMLNKQPGLSEDLPLRSVSLDLSFQGDGDAAPDAYQRLLLDVLRNNPTLFVRADEVEQAWRWIDRIQEAWARLRRRPQHYIAGSWGPSAAYALIARDGRSWYESAR